MDFKGKVGIVTGGGNGIGRAVSLRMAKLGGKIVVVDQDAQGAKDVAAEIKNQGGEAAAFTADVTRSTEVAAYVKFTLDTYGRIDCFHNNAGIEGITAPLVDYDEAAFDQLMAVNVKGAYLGLHHVLPIMMEQKSGSIVNTGSILSFMGAPKMAPYTASKHAILGLTRAVAGEAAPYGIRINAVCPGSVDTRMIHSLESMLSPDDPNAAQQRNLAAIPLGRYVTSEEVADTVLFLLSDMSSSTTAAHFVIDGGRTATSGLASAAAKR